jgi:hypothetical protein
MPAKTMAIQIAANHPKPLCYVKPSWSEEVNGGCYFEDRY